MVTQTGCDAVMIGRTAPSNPWIFRQIEQYCAGMDREGHDFSRAHNPATYGSAVAAEVGSHSEAGIPSGAEARFSLVPNGTAEAVPFPSVSRPAVSLLSQSYDEPTEADRYQMIRTYFQMLIEEELPDAVGKMKQFASWFTHGVPGGAGLRKAIYESKSDGEDTGASGGILRSQTVWRGRPFGKLRASSRPRSVSAGSATLSHTESVFLQGTTVTATRTPGYRGLNRKYRPSTKSI